jgi:hypothetical protein
MEMHSLNMQLLYALVRKPIILQEFGYIGGGEPKTPEQKLEIIQGYGFASEQEARENVDVFIERLPALFRYHILTGHPNPEDWERAVFEEVAAMHLYRELPAYNVIPGYPHTPEGQAAFYTDVLPMLRELDFLAGVFIYCYADSDMCYFCGQHDCPVETKWGLVTAAATKSRRITPCKPRLPRIDKEPKRKGFGDDEDCSKNRGIAACRRAVVYGRRTGNAAD